MSPARALGPGAIVLVLLGCSIRPERSVLAEFFAASRLRDTTALSRISLVVLEPREVGAVGEFKIRNVSGQRRLPFSPDSQVARLSLLGRPDPRARGGQPGEIETEDVTLTAPLRTPDGRKAEVSLVVTLDRAVLGNDRETGRWIVTAVRGAAVARALPRP